MERSPESTFPRPLRPHGTFELTMAGRTLPFHTRAGVFSHGEPDAGTVFLLETLLPHVKPHAIVLDLGTGVGIIGLAVAAVVPRTEVWMVDVDLRAVRLAEENMKLNRIENAHVVLSDVTLDLPSHLRFDLVVSNPPTHSGREVLEQFIAEAHRVLRPGGSLYVVINRMLSVRRMMEATFGEVEQVERKKGFIVLRAEKIGRKMTAR